MLDGNAVAERLHDQANSLRPDPAPFYQQAKDELADRLRDGKSVGGCELIDLLDSELDGERYKIALQEVVGLLLDTGMETAAKADQVRDGIIERYLESPKGQELIEEQAAQIAFDEEDA